MKTSVHLCKTVLQKGQRSPTMELPFGTAACQAYETGTVSKTPESLPGDALCPWLDGWNQGKMKKRILVNVFIIAIVVIIVIIIITFATTPTPSFIVHCSCHPHHLLWSLAILISIIIVITSLILSTDFLVFVYWFVFGMCRCCLAFLIAGVLVFHITHYISHYCSDAAAIGGLWQASDGSGRPASETQPLGVGHCHRWVTSENHQCTSTVLCWCWICRSARSVRIQIFVP